MKRISFWVRLDDLRMCMRNLKHDSDWARKKRAQSLSCLLASGIDKAYSK